MRDGTDGPQTQREQRAFPCLSLARTFGGQKVDEHGHGRDEDAGHDDVDDVEERLALDDEVEDNLLVLGVIWGEVLRIDDLPSRAVLDGPFTVLCHAEVPRESHCPAGGIRAASPPARGGRKVKAGAQCGPHGAPRMGTVRLKVLGLGREMSTTKRARVPGQNTPKRRWREQLGTYGAPRDPQGLPQ